MDEDFISLLNERIGLWVSAVYVLSQYEKVELQEKNKYFPIIYDLQLSISIANLDIAIGIKHLCNAKSALEMNYFARILALNCRELFNDINKLNVRLIDSTKNIKYQSFNNALSEFKNKITELNKYKGLVLNKVEFIRHNLIAHRGGDGISQARNIENVDYGDMLGISETLIGHTSDLFSITRNMLLAE